jgi:S-adenosylmethionine-dependent methyltransferase
VDVASDSLAVARKRAELHGVDAKFVCGNSTEVARLMEAEAFACVAFIASLEHMTLEERLTTLREAWKRLGPGGHLIVVESPNRLWFVDDHTAREPFFHWLPEDLAFRYSPFTRRPLFNESFRDTGDKDAALRFARWGRCLSFHEFVVAFGVPAAKLPVVSYLNGFLRRRALLPLPSRLTRAGRYEKFLHSACADLPSAFCSEYIDVIFRK